jgi:hypothetical protein
MVAHYHKSRGKLGVGVINCHFAGATHLLRNLAVFQSLASAYGNNYKQTALQLFISFKLITE